MSIIDSFRLDDRVVLVTGASSGLGEAFALAVAEAGADVVLAARRESRLASTASRIRELGREALVVQTDVADPSQCERAVTATVERFGRLDVLINNAGVGDAIPASREAPDHFRRIIDINLNGCYWMAQSAGRVMKPGSSIVNISSILALTTSNLPQAAYSSSKAGLLGLTRDLAQQWGLRKGIRVNAIAPGYFSSEMTSRLNEDYVAALKARTVLGRFGDTDELSASLIWLVSSGGGFVTGQTIIVDGGFCVS